MRSYNLSFVATLDLELDFLPILQQHAEQAKSLSAELQLGVQALATATHAHVLQEANKKLHSRLEMYTKATHLEQLAPNVWAVTVKKEALWIEDGMSEHSMIPDLLAGAEKRGKLHHSKDGTAFMVVPFQHAKGPTQQTPEAASITGKLRAELKQRKIPYQKIERDQGGKPRLGLLHTLNLGGEQRPATKINQAWSSPVLDGVRIYQNVVKDKKGRESVRRDVMTFRIASSKHFGLKWNHPGDAGVKLLDEALTWATQHWEREVLPIILAKYS